MKLREMAVVIGSLSLIACCVSCKEQPADIKQIMKSIPSDYKKQKNVNGVMRETYFFKRDIGYGQPMEMDGPLSYEETQKGKYAYLEASLDTSGEVPLLIFVEKFIVRREPITIEEEQVNKKSIGDVYYLFHKLKDKVILEKEVKLEDTFSLKEYAHIMIDKAGNITSCELAKKEFVWSEEYEYDKKGLLIRMKSKAFDYEGTVVRERGKDF